MVHCEIHEDYLIIDCCSSDLYYVLDKLENIPHRKLSFSSKIYAIAVDKFYSHKALLALAESLDVQVV